MLVKLGADPEDQTHNGRTCAALAAQHGKASTIKLLADLGADIDEPGTMFGGRTPLHFAAAAGDAATVKILLRLGADARATDNMRNAASHHAALEGHAEIVKLLEEYDFPPDQTNDEGLTTKDLLEQFAARDEGGGGASPGRGAPSPGFGLPPVPALPGGAAFLPPVRGASPRLAA